MNKFCLALCFCTIASLNIAAAVVLPATATVDGYVYTDPYPMKIMSMPISGVKAYLLSQLAILQQTPGVAITVLVDSAITDATGHFVFKPAATGSYNVSFLHAGYVSLTVSISATKDTTMRVSMLATGAHGAVRGRVLSGCAPSPLAIPCILKPLPKCTVTVMIGTLYTILAKQSAVIYPPVAAQIFTSVTNDSGNYSIDSIPISANNTHVTVTAVKGGFVSQSVDTGLWNMTTTMVNFTLTPAQIQAGGDSVYTTPPKPLTKDSITYNFYDADACCCAQFVNPVILVQDTMVILSFSVNTNPCMLCDCIAAGKWYAFKGGRLAAGRYGIYRQENIYCPPGQACPAIIALPVKIGEVVVTNTASVGPTAPHVTPLSGLVLTQEKSTISLSVVLPQPGRVRVNVFNARGICAGEIFNGQATPGAHRFSWTAAAPGVYFMSAEMNGVAACSRKIIISQ
jgi:hypothetical protein